MSEFRGVAQLSAHYATAVFLRDRELTLTQFEPSRYDDPALRRFAAENVVIQCDADLNNGQAVATVELRNGQTFAARCEAPLGAPENPVSFGQVQDKFRTYAKPRYSKSQIEDIIEAVAQLDDLSSIRILVGQLREPARP